MMKESSTGFKYLEQLFSEGYCCEPPFGHETLHGAPTCKTNTDEGCLGGLVVCTSDF